MKSFLIKYRTQKNGVAAEIIFAQNQAHAFGIAREKYGNLLVQVIPK